MSPVRMAVILRRVRFGRDRVADEHGLVKRQRVSRNTVPGPGGRRAELGVNVQRVVVAGNLAVEPYLLLRERRRTPGLLPHG